MRQFKFHILLALASILPGIRIFVVVSMLCYLVGISIDVYSIIAMVLSGVWVVAVQAWGWSNSYAEIRIFFAWYDFWRGFYWDRKRHRLYFCPLPCIVFEIYTERWG